MKKNAVCVRITNAPNAAYQPPKPNGPKNNASSHSNSKKKAPGRVWTLTFLLGAEQTNQTNPKIPAPTVHADRSLHSTATKKPVFRAHNHHSSSSLRRRRRAYHERRRPPSLAACVSSVVESFSSSEEWASGPGPAWCVEGGGDGVSACVVLSSVLPLAARGPVFFSGKCDPRCLPLDAPRPPLRE